MVLRKLYVPVEKLSLETPPSRAAKPVAACEARAAAPVAAEVEELGRLLTMMLRDEARR
jgi:hypothetical protein